MLASCSGVSAGPTYGGKHGKERTVGRPARMPSMKADENDRGGLVKDTALNWEDEDAAMPDKDHESRG